jgi:tetratricopeptide (TPR) repeat protein
MPKYRKQTDLYVIRARGGGLAAALLLASSSIAFSTLALTASPVLADGGSVQYGSVNEENHSSFRLKRANPTPTSPQVSQPSDSMSSVATPDLTPLYQAQPTFDNTPPAETRSSTTWRPGVILTGSAGDQSLNPTCDLSLAEQQAQEFPTSPEAAFIYAVDLTKTSQVERALKEVRRARNLAQATGDPNYFSRAVGQYEETLAAEPDNNCIRYSLGWAYYMQAYLLAERARKEAQTQAILAGQAPQKRSKVQTDLFGGASILASMLTGTRPDASAVPHIPGALENTPAWAQPQIKIFYQKCLAALDGVTKRDPKDAWAAVYAAHVREEYDGDHTVALTKLQLLKKSHPDNPAAAFFLADAYARSGNIAAGAGALTQALGLHAAGK